MNKSSLIGILPYSDNTPVLIQEEQDVYDIMDLLAFAHKKNMASYDKIAPFFWTGDIYSTCEKLYNFCKRNVLYDVESEDMQTVRGPRKILENGAGDCKHYASFINGVLSAIDRDGLANINCIYRFASYKLFDEIPTHVFAVVKLPGHEIWIDPVLDHFDEHRPYTFGIDRKVSSRPVAVGSCDYECESDYLGAMTTAETGQLIAKVAPNLAYIPVVGWALAAAGEVVGLALATFGYRWHTQWSVRWLIQLYQYYVLGQTGVTASNANEALADTAVSWFSHVCGVPVLDRTMFDLLKGYKYAENVDLHKSYDQRATEYLGHTSTAGISHDMAVAAAKITDSLNYNMAPGMWKNATAAPWLIDKTTSSGQSSAPGLPAGTQIPGGSLLSSGSGLEGYLPIVLIGVAAYLILK